MTDRPGPRALIEEISQRNWPSASIAVKDSLLAAQMGYSRETVRKWRERDKAPAWVVCQLERMKVTRSGA